MHQHVTIASPFSFLSQLYLRSIFLYTLCSFQGQDIRKTIPDSFLLRAPSAETPEKESILDTTWKAVIEPSLDIPFDNMKKIDANTMSTSGLQKDVLMLDEQAVRIFMSNKGEKGYTTHHLLLCMCVV